MEIDKLIERWSLSDKITTSRVYVFFNSVLCMGEMRSDPNAAWMYRTKGYAQNNHLKELNRIDGMQTEFVWKIFSGFTTLGIFEEMQTFMTIFQSQPEHFNGRISFMSMLMTLSVEKTTIPKNVHRIL